MLDHSPVEIVSELVAARACLSDSQVLAELATIPPLADEDNACWESLEYWLAVAYPYFALARIAKARRLRAAIPLILERACYGDPGESMRGLRHTLEAIVDPDFAALADMCLQAAGSSRLGTRLWAMDELTVLEDSRAKPLFEEAARSGREELRRVAENGLRRLARAKEQLADG